MALNVAITGGNEAQPNSRPGECLYYVSVFFFPAMIANSFDVGSYGVPATSE
jgi:hypothetical protein